MDKERGVDRARCRHGKDDRKRYMQRYVKIITRRQQFRRLMRATSLRHQETTTMKQPFGGREDDDGEPLDA